MLTIIALLHQKYSIKHFIVFCYLTELLLEVQLSIMCQQCCFFPLSHEALYSVTHLPLGLLQHALHGANLEE